MLIEETSPLLDEYELFEFSEEGKKVEVRIPRLTPNRVEEIKENIRKNRDENLVKRTTKEIMEVFSRVNQQWTDKNYALRKEALDALPTVTGLSPQMVELTLDAMMKSFTYNSLYTMLELDLGHPFLFDKFVRLPGISGLIKGYVRNDGPKIITVSNAGNAPMLPVLSTNRCYLMKSGSLNKVAAEEPSFLVLYKKSIRDVDEDIAKCMEIVYWKGGNREVEKKAFNVDGLEIYGGPTSVSDIKEIVEEIEREGMRKIPANYYEHKLGFGYLGREFLNDRVIARIKARGGAMSTSLYDQQACFSSHVFYVEEGGIISPVEWAKLLAEEMEAINKALPRGHISRETKEAISYLRGDIEFDKTMGKDVEIIYPDNTDWTVIYDGDKKFEPSCSYRVVRVKPVKDMEEVIECVEPIKQYLQTVGVALSKERKLKFANQLGKLGANRICELENMGFPQVGPHDGYLPIRRLLEGHGVKYVTIEG